MILTSFLFDRFHSRGLFVADVMMISCLGWIIFIAVVHDQHIRYFATFLVTMGAFAGIPFTLSWVSNNSGNESQRAVELSILNGISQCFAILAAFIFSSSEKPYWHKGFGINLGFNALAVILALILYVSLRLENARRDKKEGGRASPDVKIDVFTYIDLAPGFRYVP